jgi:hypothetical protein
MREGLVSEQDLEPLQRGCALFNEGNFDALREFVSADIVVERDGEAERLRAWDELRAFIQPDAFEWQRNDPLDYSVQGDKVLVRIELRARGAGSGIELTIAGWHVWTVKDGLAVHMLSTADDERARERFHTPASG